ncbi:unnamed protein product [Mytilus edulis]|uniref:Novel STAND NTPase 3 domain-containing protein n=1 Tax=Mytilus edulis TaxID=6550 RepID=A0A8S3RS44_MYTED|nr:unnamed protein product [Mytilus edulis]
MITIYYTSGLTKTEIDGHLNELTFVETPAYRACIKLLENELTSDINRSSRYRKKQKQFRNTPSVPNKYPEYKSVKLTDFCYDFTDVVTEEEKLVILFEDIFGRTNTRFAENTDVQIIDRIHACTIKGNIKVVLTVRDTIRMSCQWIPIHTKFSMKTMKNILDNMWVSVRSLDMSEITEYIRSSINRVCSLCPMTTMRWMLNNIDQRVFDMNQLMKRACEFKMT